MEDTMTIHEAKEIIQEEAKLELIRYNGGLVAIATGGGKSKIAIDYCKYIQEDVAAPLKILIVVPTEKLRDRDWADELEKWWSDKPEAVVVDKYCYASINKLLDNTYDITILDEVQNITPHNAVFFENNSYGDIVSLSATPPPEPEKKEILEDLNVEVVYNLPLDEAVRRGVVSPFKLIFVEFNLDAKTKYIKAGNQNKSWMTTETKQYEYLSRTLKQATIGLISRSVKHLRLQRMRFIYNLDSRRKVAEYVLDKIIPKQERTLIFAGSIKLAETLEPNTFHSKSNSTAFDKFVNQEINRLSAVDSLNEGVNIPNLDNAFIVQVKSKERHLIQKIGRIIRWREGHIAKIYIMYAKGTVDEEWMEKATENIDKNSIELIKFAVK